MVKHSTYIIVVKDSHGRHYFYIGETTKDDIFNERVKKVLATTLKDYEFVSCLEIEGVMIEQELIDKYWKCYACLNKIRGPFVDIREGKKLVTDTFKAAELYMTAAVHVPEQLKPWCCIEDGKIRNYVYKN